MPLSGSKDIQNILKLSTRLIPYFSLHESSCDVIRTELLLSAILIASDARGLDFLGSIRFFITEICIMTKPFSKCSIDALVSLKEAIPDQINVSLRYITPQDTSLTF